MSKKKAQEVVEEPTQPEVVEAAAEEVVEEMPEIIEPSSKGKERAEASEGVAENPAGGGQEDGSDTVDAPKKNKPTAEERLAKIQELRRRMVRLLSLFYRSETDQNTFVESIHP